jgi:hypothetical protein
MSLGTLTRNWLKSMVPQPYIQSTIVEHDAESFLSPALTRIIHETSTAAADPGMSSALRSVGLLDVLSSTPAAPSIARLVFTPVCAASRRTFMHNAG